MRPIKPSRAHRHVVTVPEISTEAVAQSSAQQCVASGSRAPSGLGSSRIRRDVESRTEQNLLHSSRFGHMSELPHVDWCWQR
jgi:hypothetical protein